MSRIKLSPILWCVLFCCPVFGQMTNNYRDQITHNVVTTYGVCGPTATSDYCWRTFSGAPLLSQIAVGRDGSLWGVLQGSSTAVHYNPSTTNWDDVAPVPGGAKKMLSTDANTVYAVSLNGGIYQYNSGTLVWTQLPQGSHFFIDASVGADGDLWTIGNSSNGCGNNVFHWSAGNSTWVLQTFGLSQISVVNAGMVVGVCKRTIVAPADNLYVWTPATGAALQTGSGWFSEVSAFVPDGNDINVTSATLWGVFSDGTLKHNDNVGSGGWDRITGTPTLVSGGSTNLVYGLFAGTLRHYSAYTISISYNVSGSATCNSGCGTNVNHTGTAYMQIGAHTAVQNTQSVPYASYLNVQSTDTLTPMEASVCVFGEQGAVLGPCPSTSTSGHVTCPMMGSVFASSVGGWSLDIEGADTKLIATSGKQFGCKTVFGAQLCQQPVQPWCSNTSSPDLHPATVWTEAGPVWTGTWNDTAVCMRIHYGITINSSWYCSPGVARRSTDLSPGYCTYNP